MPIWILSLVTKLRSLPIKQVLMTVGLVVLLAGEWYLYHKAWHAGYDKAHTEVEAANAAAINAAVERAKLQWEKSAAAGASALLIEKSITRNLRDVEKRITSAVASGNTACRNLGESVLRVYNDAIDAANGAAAAGSP
jgi:hypothetical protein